MTYLKTFFTLCLATSSVLAFAHSHDNGQKPMSSHHEQPALDSGFFIGVGGSYNSLTLDRTLAAKGSVSVSLTAGSSSIASGTYNGNSDPFDVTQNTFAPQGQIGYAYYCDESPWMVGIKGLYQYLGMTFTQSDIDSFPTQNYPGEDNTFRGHITISSAQTAIDHEIALLPQVGYTWGRTQAYLGAGAVVFGTTSKLFGVNSFVEVSGSLTSVNGNERDFSQDQWMWGGMGQLGLTHTCSDHCFIDFNYNYAVTGNNSLENRGEYTNTISVSGSSFNQTATGVINTLQSIVVQSVMLSINLIF